MALPALFLGPRTDTGSEYKTRKGEEFRVVRCLSSKSVSSFLEKRKTRTFSHIFREGNVILRRPLLGATVSTTHCADTLSRHCTGVGPSYRGRWDNGRNKMEVNTTWS